MKTKISAASIAVCFLFISGPGISSNAQTRPVKSRPQSARYFNRMDTIERSIILTSYPTNFVAATIKVGCEFKVAHNKGLKFIGSFGSSTENGDWYGLDEFREFGLEAQLRFYVQKDRPALNGFYLAPIVSFKSMTYTDNNLIFNPSTGQPYSQNGSVSNFMLGYVIGYQWIFNSSFVIDAFIGGGNNFISGDNTQGNLSNTIYAYRNGIDLHTGIGLGVAF